MPSVLGFFGPRRKRRSESRTLTPGRRARRSRSRTRGKSGPKEWTNTWGKRIVELHEDNERDAAMGVDDAE